MRFRLRTLLILLAVGPVLLAGLYWFLSLEPTGSGGYYDGYKFYPHPPPKDGFHPEWTGNGYINVPNAPRWPD